MKRIIENIDSVPIDKDYNFFNDNICRTRIHKGEKPPESERQLSKLPEVDWVIFMPLSYLTPMEKIIQRLILKQMKQLFDSFKGTEKQFNDTTFEIYTSTIVDMLGGKKCHREINSAFRKLFSYQLEIKTRTSQSIRHIVKDGKRDLTAPKKVGRWTFRPSTLFQMIRTEKHRIQHSILHKDSSVIPYVPVSTTLLDVANLDNKYQQQFILFLLDFWETETHRKGNKQTWQLNDQFFADVINKDIEKLTNNDKVRYRNAIKELNEMPQYKGMFEIVGMSLNVLFRK